MYRGRLACLADPRISDDNLGQRAKPLPPRSTMPTLIVHETNKLARKAPFLVKTFRIGRDPACELVLNSPTVSREHAVIRMDGATGNWFISCTSNTNPVVVDGQLVSETAWVKEGAEILVGSDHLLLFSETEQRAAGPAAGQARFVKTLCPKCNWAGMISSLRRDAPCPRCGATGMHAADAYVKAVTEAATVQNETSAMDLDQVRASLRQLKTAKRSHVARIDSWSDGGTQHDLTEAEPLYIARDGPLKLRGLVWGRVKIAWHGRRWQCTSELLFGALRVNGEPTKQCMLRDGDTLEVGNCRFKVVTD